MNLGNIKVLKILNWIFNFLDFIWEIMNPQNWNFKGTLEILKKIQIKVVAMGTYKAYYKETWRWHLSFCFSHSKAFDLLFQLWKVWNCALDYLTLSKLTPLNKLPKDVINYVTFDDSSKSSFLNILWMNLLIMFIIVLWPLMFILFDGVNGNTSFNTFLEDYFVCSMLFKFFIYIVIYVIMLSYAWNVSCSKCRRNNFNTHQGSYVRFVITRFECMF